MEERASASVRAEEHAHLQRRHAGAPVFVLCQVVTRGSLELRAGQSRSTDFQGHVN